jgi:hypothetical protein
MGRMILVSNRLPVTLRHARGSSPELIRSSGGLVAGLDPLHQRTDSLWVGYPGEDPDTETHRLLSERRLVPVSLTAAEVRGHYQGYSNGALWPLFHYLLEHCRFDPAEYDTYHRVNEKFAEVVLENAAPHDVIWVHDYHLLLLPGMLRKKLPRARIGFFLHTPFPSVELFRILPQRDQILEGLIATLDTVVGTVGGIARTAAQPGGLLSQTINTLGQTVQLLVTHTGSLLERTLGTAGQLVNERTVGHVLDLPVLRQTTGATGEVVVLIDSDCVAEPQWLSAILSRFDDPTVDAVAGDTTIIPTSAQAFACAVSDVFHPYRRRPNAHRYFPDNMAIRRSTVAAHPFREVDGYYRGFGAFHRGHSFHHHPFHRHGFHLHHFHRHHFHPHHVHRHHFHRGHFHHGHFHHGHRHHRRAGVFISFGF